jgi:cytochrome c5
MKRCFAFLLIVLIFILTLVRCSPTQDAAVLNSGKNSVTVQTEQSVTNTIPTPIDGSIIVANKCGTCHASSRVTGALKTMDEWTATVDRMIAHGASLSAEERQALIDFLAATYSK